MLVCVVPVESSFALRYDFIAVSDSLETQQGLTENDGFDAAFKKICKIQDSKLNLVLELVTSSYRITYSIISTITLALKSST